MSARRVLFRWVCLLLLTGNNTAFAALTLYTNRTAWAAAVPNNVTIGFESVAPPIDPQLVPTPPKITLSGVNFNIDHTSNNGSLYVLPISFVYSDNAALSSQASETFVGPQNIVASLPPGTTAVAVDFGDLAPFPGGHPVGFSLSTGNSFTRLTTGYGGFYGPNWFAFIGMTSDVPISWLRIEYSSGTALNIDNFSYGTVPEPSVSVLLLVGIPIVLLASRFRKFVYRRNVHAQSPCFRLSERAQSDTSFPPSSVSFQPTE